MEMSQWFGYCVKHSTSVNVFKSPDIAKWCPYVVRIRKKWLTVLFATFSHWIYFQVTVWYLTAY